MIALSSRLIAISDRQQLKGLNKLVSSFPAKKRMRFVDTHGIQHYFPFSAFISNHNMTLPDLAATFPGVSQRQLPAKTSWPYYSMILEAKGTRRDDPFEKDGLCHCKTLVQLAINARCLLHAHGLLATFVVGIYGDIVRIARFDHSCAVVSGRLFLKNPADLALLRQFFWCFVNPITPGPFVGWDPTVRRLTDQDEIWLKGRLKAIGEQVDGKLIKEARRVELPEETLVEGGEPPAYILYKVLDVNGRLFSRATTVWLGVRDTRRRFNGQIVDRPELDDLKPRVVKESWRQLVRRSERDLYARLRAIPRHLRVGLPDLMCGGDLGEEEVQRWESAHRQTLATHATTAAKHRWRLSPSNRKVGSEPGPTSSPASNTMPPHRPMQQTFSWRLVGGGRYWYRERSHMRFVTDTVGRPLNCFRCTKELVTAVRDAILGEWLMIFLAPCNES